MCGFERTNSCLKSNIDKWTSCITLSFSRQLIYFEVLSRIVWQRAFYSPSCSWKVAGEFAGQNWGPVFGKEKGSLSLKPSGRPPQRCGLGTVPLHPAEKQTGTTPK